MRPYRQDRLTRAWNALLPDSIPRPIRFIGMILLGLFSLPWAILVWTFIFIRWILILLYRQGERTYTSILITVNDPDAQ